MIWKLNISIITLLWFSTFACRSFNSSPMEFPFEVLEATSQQWIAGVQGGGGGTNYKVKLLVKTNSTLVFDSIWVAGKKLKIQIKRVTEATNNSLLDDTLTLLASDYTESRDRMRRPNQRPVSPDSIKASISYKGAALIKYYVNDVKKYYTIPRITALPPILGH